MLATLATGQHGVVARRQLCELGLTDSVIAYAVGLGRLDRMHRGVYAVGHPSSASAAGGWPVTTPERTVLDVAATLTPRQLERTLDQAEILRVLDWHTVDAVVRAHANHHGARRLRETLERHHPGTTLTKSELEEAFLALCRAQGLPRPQVNTYVEDLEVDFLFPGHSLAVETDGWGVHRTRRAFERDRERDATLTRAGYRVLRFTDRQLTHEPATVVATLAAALRLQ
ncbi:MAG: hypothetical protein QOD44_2538 [Solirubrobacteraceae bacterium]|jgi:very-short-patch-repair endonuclease|nr:hypothetical protein [Solirubrobacteraceae bacterium]MEA2318349.1 hypothetical protein [Solirubrobacteraceae bacterium]